MKTVRKTIGYKFILGQHQKQFLIHIGSSTKEINLTEAVHMTLLYLDIVSINLQL